MSKTEEEKQALAIEALREFEDGVRKGEIKEVIIFGVDNRQNPVFAMAGTPKTVAFAASHIQAQYTQQMMEWEAKQ